MTKENTALIALLRLAVGNADDAVLPTDLNWERLIETAREQHVSVIAFDGLDILYTKHPERHIPIDLPDMESVKMDWYNDINVLETAYARHERMIGKIAAKFRKAGIRTMLMKGYGLSLNYPFPPHRPVGDIDIYLYDDKEKGDEIVRGTGVRVNDVNRHHSSFVLRGIVVENHRTFLDVDMHPSNARLEKILTSLVDDNNTAEIAGETVYLPSPTLNAIYLLRHAGEHFVSDCIQLRHILDLALFFENNRTNIDWKLVLNLYELESMMPFYNAIATFCVTYLGFSKDVFQGMTMVPDMAGRMIADTFRTTATGKCPKRSKIMSYGIFKTRMWWHNRWKHSMVYRESLISSYLALSKKRLGEELVLRK